MVKKIRLNSDDELTVLVKGRGIEYWEDLLSHVQNIPYGRNHERTNFKLVLTQNKGTCSSKHALLRQIADTNQIENVKLLIGIYKMDVTNTPGIGNHLIDHGIEYIPEAHCYLMKDGKRLDITNPDSNIKNLEKYILEEIEIEPEQVGEFKVNYHQEFLKDWIYKTSSHFEFEELWTIREKCIHELSKSSH